MIEKDALVEEVLSYINSARILAGYIPLNDLKQGRKNKSAFCPIAMSLKDFIPGISIEYETSAYGDQSELIVKSFKSIKSPLEGEEDSWVENPDCFDEFIELFDEGRYPQYEEKR